MGETWARMGSTLAGLMFLWAFIQQFIPYEFRRYIEKGINTLVSFTYPYVEISIHEHIGDGLKRSEAYIAVESYLSTNTARNIKRLKAEMGKNNKLTLSMDDYEKLTDEYQGAKVWWSLNKIIRSSIGSTFHNPEPERRYYKLTFHKRYRELVTESYLEHVMKEGKAMKERKRQRKLYTNSPGYNWSSYKSTIWSHIAFEHPASFQTLTMDSKKKQEIVDDLVAFSNGKDYYAKIGKAWKRGYLLYGPPGTGKSTMIAAMAKLLDYDVYDLELTAVKDNTELRKLLVEVTNRSILVIEDIDCSLDLTGQRNNKAERLTKSNVGEEMKKSNDKEEVKELTKSNISKVTLSGLLNFIDGLWSSCGEERLVVFTTNYVGKLDPALVRRGRMDKHIELSYCSFDAFKVLAKNYLVLESHPLFDCIHKLMNETKMTPADVAENLMPKSVFNDAETRLLNLIQALQEVKEETERSNVKQNQEDDANAISALLNVSQTASKLVDD
ncbi:hypothetical protein Scep_017604 [Stephania cephalantha]|uniref:AAA+ ATPase domain-containing protein n=1 Tax=Stephania cephalantha TaxID=152367 RepID=A0AAP0IPU6_9MAGN